MAEIGVHPIQKQSLGYNLQVKELAIFKDKNKIQVKKTDGKKMCGVHLTQLILSKFKSSFKNEMPCLS